MSYEGPTRQEIILEVIKYNDKHDKHHQIKINYASKEKDLGPIEQILQDEARASDSAQQLRATLKEIQKLRREQLKKGPPSSRSDWMDIRSIGKKLVDAAEKAMGKHDFGSTTNPHEMPRSPRIYGQALSSPRHRPVQVIDPGLSKRETKPPPIPPRPTAAHAEKHKPAAHRINALHETRPPISTYPEKGTVHHTTAHHETKVPTSAHPHTQPDKKTVPHHPTATKTPSSAHAKREKHPTHHTKAQKEAKRPTPHTTSHPETRKPADPARPQESQHQMQEERERREPRERFERRARERQEVIRQKELKAHEEATALHSEVRKMAF